MSVRPSIGAMNALNWNNSTGVSLLAGRRLGLAEQDRSSVKPFVNSSSTKATVKCTVESSVRSSLALSMNDSSACQIERSIGILKATYESTFAQKGGGRQCVENRCSQAGRTENGRPGKGRTDKPIDKQAGKPKKKLKKSRKLIKQQSNQIQQFHQVQQKISQQQSSHTGDLRPARMASESLANGISRQMVTGKPTNRPASGEARSRPLEEEHVQTKVQNRFSWKKYLKDTNSLAAPLNCFKPNQTFNNKPNYFKPGMKLEAIDPNHPSLFCVASVVEICGFRMRIHLDNYNSQFDFWV